MINSQLADTTARTEMTAAESLGWISVAAAILAAAVGTVLVWGTPQYLVNDDIVMGLIADGSLSGTPSSELVFANRVVGGVLAALYALVPGFGWYALALLATTLTTLLLLAWAARGSAMWVKVLWALFALPAVLFLTQRPNFTATAILTCTVGLAVLAVKPMTWRWLATGSVLVLIGVLWREDALVAAVIASAASIVIGLLKQGYKRLAVLTGVVSGAVVLSKFGQGCWALKSERCAAWYKYLEYNEARGALHSTLRGNLLYPLAGADIGWGPNAAELFRIFAFFDDPLFHDPVLEADRLVPVVLNVQGGSLSSHVLTTVETMTTYWPLLLVWTLVALVGAWWTVRPSEAGKRTAVIVGAALGTVFAASVVAFIRWPALPVPVVFGLVLAFGAQTVIISTKVRGEGVAPWPVATIVALAALGLMGYVVVGDQGVVATGRDNRSNQQAVDHLVERLESYAGRPIVGSGRLFGFFAANPYVATPASMRSNLPLLSGWPIFSPDWMDRKERLGFRNVYRELITSRTDGRPPVSVPLFMGSETEAQFTALFMSKELGLSRAVWPVPVSALGSGVSLWLMSGSG